MKHNDIAVQLVVNKLVDWSHKATTPKRMAGTLFEAAQIIKQLQEERERLRKSHEEMFRDLQAVSARTYSLRAELEKAIQERDAAVADLKFIKPCIFCANKDNPTCPPGNKCDWKWRGVKEE